MRYGSQRVQTVVGTELSRLRNQRDVLMLMDQFYQRYGERFGEGSQSPEAGIRINTLRVCSYVEQPTVQFESLKLNGHSIEAPPSVGERPCHFVGHDGALSPRLYDDRALADSTP